MYILLDAPPRRLLGHFIPAPLPPPGTFAGQTVLIVGGTAGIGLATAVHYATLGANVIITCRVPSRGDAAVRHIREAAAGSSYNGEVSWLMLEMESYDSCAGFIQGLKEKLISPAALDVAIVNAGLINSHWEESVEGWEKTIQVNTISTTLIGLLLLGWMRQGRAQRAAAARGPAHLAFVTSRDHIYPDVEGQLTGWSQKEGGGGGGGILRQVASRDNWPGWWEPEPNYAISKLLVMYTIEEISRLARGADGDPLVIVNSMCPGMVKTDIGRHIASKSWLFVIVVFLTMLVTAKSADSGARICVMAGLKPKEDHGKFFNFWLTPSRYEQVAAPNMSSDAARTLQRLVWKDVIGELKENVPVLLEDAELGLDGL